MRLLSWLVLGMLAACASPAPRAGDHVTVVWNRVDNVQQVCQNLDHRKEIWTIRGCSKWSDTGPSGERVCSIYVPAPRSETDREGFVTLGHELMHCFDGNWHDRWGRMNPDEKQAALGASAARKPAAAAD